MLAGAHLPPPLQPHGIQYAPPPLLSQPDSGSPPKTAAALRTVFNRMGFNDREIVALSGAHALGRCHADASVRSRSINHGPDLRSAAAMRGLGMYVTPGPTEEGNLPIHTPLLTWPFTLHFMPFASCGICLAEALILRSVAPQGYVGPWTGTPTIFNNLYFKV